MTKLFSIWLVDVTGNCSGDMIGWFGDRADNASPDGAEFFLQAALEKEREGKRDCREHELLQFSPGVPACSGKFLVQSD